MTTPPLSEAEQRPNRPPDPAQADRLGILFDVLFVVVLLAGAYFRCGPIGSNEAGRLVCSGHQWDEGTYLHPDERFLAIVESKIEPAASWSEYFDTATSPLNPNNKGEGFFVYGTLPIFLVRYVMEWTGNVGYGQVAEIGRPLASLFDLLTIFFLYLAAGRLYGRWVGLLAAAFSAFAVLQIQLSHFFTVDIFANVFVWAAIYFGIRITAAKPPSARITDADPPGHPEEAQASRPLNDPVEIARRTLAHPLLVPFILFGTLTGAAAASKISAFPVAFLLPLAAWAYFSRDRDAREVVPVLGMLAAAGILAALTFRIFQPYAFSGPGFFGITPNPHWLETIGRLQQLVEPSSGYPPSVQWFDRPLWFSGWNLTAWGLGLPLGLAAWMGFAWMGLRILRGEWRQHILVWAWVGGHFIWQSQVPNPTMRYQLPIYPGMALMAAWGLRALWDWAGRSGLRARIRRPVAGLAGAAVLVLTLLYAAAFSNIYRSGHPDRSEMTRLEGSRWIYRNAPGALTLTIQGADEALTQLLSFPNESSLRPGEAFSIPFTPRAAGVLSEIRVPHIDPASFSSAGSALYVTLFEENGDPAPMASAFTELETVLDVETGSQVLLLDIGGPVDLRAFTGYRIEVALIGILGSVDLCEPMKLLVLFDGGASELEPQTPDDCRLTPEAPLQFRFTPEADIALQFVLLGPPRDLRRNAEPQSVRLTVWGPGMTEPAATAVLAFSAPVDGAVFRLDRPVTLDPGQGYRIELSLDAGSPLALSGTVLAQETSWDDPLPMRVDEYDGFGGIYRGDNNLELYWADDPEKVERIIRVLDAVDLIPISSSRQWASLTRMPERWPLVEAYYRALMGCPDDLTVEACYNIAEPGMFTGRLGFELVETFTSHPTIFGFEINDQASEEAFTVYDHPKVFLFEKTADYDPDDVGAFFRGIDLPSLAIDGDGDEEPIKPLTLADAHREAQRAAGTWSELFDTGALINRSQVVATAAWYLVVFMLGLAVYPILVMVMPGLDDGGYPFARTVGLLLFAYFVWLAGSMGAAVTRPFLTIVAALLLLAGSGAFLAERKRILAFWRMRSRYFLAVEALALGLFLFMLFIRMANPDLWHPWKGGEKPMDFAYFNAVLKSIHFPPYDPWFAGGYINYYYYGYVIVGTLVKWLGIVPAVAYNLIIPTLFMLVGIGAFSIGWNLVRARTGQPALAPDDLQL
ncbi:MAG TPA: DUF2298 domain-containing protein, partial [Anaerolineales bacterium]|nr:DUF2298 domain-containing protein [Anaerolineales bacterium]